MSWTRARPKLDDDNRAFWQGGSNGNLNIMHCNDCDGFIHPPRTICRHCLSENVAPMAVSGKGKVESYTINHQPWARDMQVPFIIARVRLDDAPDVIITSNIVQCAVDDVAIDDAVMVTFEEQDGIYFPLFKKSAGDVT